MERVGFPATEGLEGLPLSPREKEVLTILRSGIMRKTAAEQLGMADETLKTHIKSAFGKLGVRNTAGAFARLDERKLAELRSTLQSLIIDSLLDESNTAHCAAVDALLAHIGDENVTFLMRSLMVS